MSHFTVQLETLPYDSDNCIITGGTGLILVRYFLKHVHFL